MVARVALEQPAPLDKLRPSLHHAARQRVELALHHHAAQLLNAGDPRRQGSTGGLRR